MKAPNPDPERVLLFDWSNQEKRGRFLVTCLAITGLGILSSFVLFRVVIASSKTANTASQSFVILSPSSLAAQHLIDYASDQSYLLLSDSSEHGQNPQSLTSASPVFVPGFKDFSLHLRDLGQAQSPELRPRLFGPANSLLPPVTIARKNKPKDSPRPTPSPPTHPFVEVSSELQSRWLTQSSRPSDTALGSNSTVVFHIAVNPLGQIITAVPLTQPELAPVSLISEVTDLHPDELYQFVRNLRFKPEPAAPKIQWAMLTVSWKS